MAYASITFSSSAGRLTNYLTSGAAHDGSGDRRYVLAAGVGGFYPQTFARQCASVRGQFGKRSTPRQAASVVLSFGYNEFDPSDPEAAERVLRIGQELARRAFPGHGALAVVQRDGTGGKWHVHLPVNGVSDRDAVLTYRRRNKTTGQLTTVQETRPAGRSFSAGMANVFRIRHEVDDLLADRAFMTSLGLEPYSNRALMVTPPEKVIASDADLALTNEYNWRDHLKDLIDEAQSDSVDIDDLRSRLAGRGVDLRERGEAGNLSYGFVDAEGKQRQARGGGARGLGAAFAREATDQRLAANLPRQPVVAKPDYSKRSLVEMLIAGIDPAIVKAEGARRDAEMAANRTARAAEALELDPTNVEVPEVVEGPVEALVEVEATTEPSKPSEAVVAAPAVAEAAVQRRRRQLAERLTSEPQQETAIVRRCSPSEGRTSQPEHDRER